MQRALEYEIDRQIALLESGGRVEHETRLWDPAAGTDAVDAQQGRSARLPLFSRAGSAAAADRHRLDRGHPRRTLPELPDARRRRFIAQYALPDYDAALLTQSHALAAYFEATAAASGNPKAASNWIMGELTRKMNELGIGIEEVPLTPDALADLIRLVDSGTISGPTAKEVFEKMYASGRVRGRRSSRPRGSARIDDEGAVEAAVRKVLPANADAVKQYRAGKKQTFGFLVGQVIKSMGGKANPALVNTIMRRELDEDPA